MSNGPRGITVQLGNLTLSLRCAWPGLQCRDHRVLHDLKRHAKLHDSHLRSRTSGGFLVAVAI
jgi:hypothetical protein